MASVEPPDDYLNFELSISEEGTRYFAKVTDSPAGESPRVQLPLLYENPQKVAEALLRLENALLRKAANVRGGAEESILREFGGMIFDRVFRHPEIATLYAASQARVQAGEGKGLRVKLRIDTPELAQLPWEYLYDSKPKDYLALLHESPVVRYLEVARPKPALSVDGSLNVLGMIANPGGEWVNINAARERERIDKAMAPHQKSGKIHFSWVPGETTQHLIDMVGKRPWHVFHFIGHGGIQTAEIGAPPSFDKETEGFIVLSDGKGGAVEVSASDLKVYLDIASLRIVVLNCCESARGTATDNFASPAAALVRRGVSAVIAMQFPISDDAAINLAGAFYDHLAANQPLEEALTHARKMVKATSPVEWGIPVLFTRAKTGRLFSGLRSVPSTGSTGASPALASTIKVAMPAADARARLRELFRE